MTSHEQSHIWRRSRIQNDHDHHQHNDKEDPPNGNSIPSNQLVSLRERIKHFTWAWFALPMSTGGIALLISSTPHRFPGLTTIGTIIYIFDLFTFLLLSVLITLRFTLHRGTLTKSLTHPTEALFFPTFWLALVNVLGNAQKYGGPSCGAWLDVTERVVFWCYVAGTFGVAVGQYVFLFVRGRLTITSMTPAWILPAFPVMLSGTLASIIAPTQPTGPREPIIVAGLTFQGLGWMISFMVYAVYIHRLIQFGLPAPNLRPGMFIAVGPPSFTGLALIGISQALPPDSAYFQARPGMILILQTMADFTAIFLWCLSFWFFCVTIICVGAGLRKMSFHLVWWAFVFPNVGFTIVTGSIGTQLNSPGILWVASAMTIVLVAVWLFVLVCHIKALLTRQIMMPGMDEDKDQYKEDDKDRTLEQQRQLSQLERE